MNFFNMIEPALLNGATVILTAVISVVAGIAARFIYVKLGAASYTKLYNFALEAFRVTDEYFRITPNVEKTVDSTFAKFKAVLLQKAPGLTDEEIDTFRLAIAGAINEGREALDPAKLAAADKHVEEPAADVPAAVVESETEQPATQPATTVPAPTEAPAAQPADATAQPAAVEGVNASDTTGAQ